MANCDEIITGGGSITLATSAVTVYDGGSLGCIVVPADPSLNDVLEALAAKVCSFAAPFPPSSTVIMDADLSSCGIAVTIGMTLNVALTNMITQICQNKTDIAAIDCTTIDAAGCYCADWDNEYWNLLVTPAITNPPVTLADVLCNMTKGIEYNYSLIPPIIATSARWRDNSLCNFMYDDTATFGDLSTNIGTLTFNVAATLYSYEGEERTILAEADVPGLIANKDNYIDYTNTGYTIIAVNVGDPAPPKAIPINIRLGFITTDGVGGISVTQLKETQSICTKNIKDLAVTTAKIEDLSVTTAKLSTTGVVAGTTDITNVTVGVDGRITAIDSDFNITAPIDGQIITYDFATTKWINTTAQQLPAGTADLDMLVWDTGSSLWQISPYEINSALDVNSFGITDTQVLAWDTGTNTYIPADNLGPVVIYCITLQELKDAFDTFNTVPARAGIAKLGANITLDDDLTLDFGEGIEIHGGFNNIGFNDGFGSWVLTCEGTKVTFKQCKFNGQVDFDQGTPGFEDTASQVCINLHDANMTTFVLLDCEFVDIVGGYDGDYATSLLASSVVNPSVGVYVREGAPIQMSRMGQWARMILSNIWISTPETGSPNNKPYGPLGLYYNQQTLDPVAGLQIICNNWAVTGLVGNHVVIPSAEEKWENYKSAMQINVAGNPSPADGFGAISYDQSVHVATTTTTGSAAGDWIKYPTMRGPVTTEAAVNPISVLGGVFGNPGDILVNGADIYMKHTAVGIDNDWSQIN